MKFQLELQRQELEIMRKNVAQFQKQIDLIAVAHGLYYKVLDKPHYITSEEYYLFMNKGIEALFLAWTEEIKKIDLDGSKKYDFTLPSPLTHE